jgi:hypothetical protein
MKDIPALRLTRLRRTALLLGIGTLVAGVSVLAAPAAHASGSTEDGEIVFSPPTGLVTTTGITYQTTTPCPPGYQGSAVVGIPDPATGAVFDLSPVNNSVAAPFSGTFNSTFALAEQAFPDLGVNGVGAVVAAYCFSGADASGTSEEVQFTGAGLEDGAYAENSGPIITAAIDLSVSPGQAAVGQTVTLTAVVTPSYAPGSVQFSANGTPIGSPVPLDNGVATLTTSFATAGTEALSAVYIQVPNSNVYPDTPGTATLVVTTSTTTVPVGSVGLIGLAALAGGALFMTQRRRRNRPSA